MTDIPQMLLNLRRALRVAAAQIASGSRFIL
jgi:hypothetical protein